MTISMYQASIPAYIRALNNLSNILTKAQANAESRKIDLGVFVNARLAPDMFPLSRQIQITTDVIKGGIARLAGSEIPSYADTETTFDELQARIKKTITFIQSFKPAQIDGSEEKPIALKVGGRDLNFTGLDYLLNFITPNVYFHITATYAILRHNGVDLGKGDYLGSM